MSNVEVYIKGSKSKVSLGTKEFIYQGGEGSVYSKNGIAYKVYEDPKKMIPEKKIQELSILTEPYISSPQQILVDSTGIPVGHTMALVPSPNFVLCEVFPMSFRNRESFTDDKALHVIKKLREGIEYCHSKSILLIDINEMNFLISPDFQTVYFIDVNSYSTKNFPPTAIMDTVRDRHMITWNQGTDWFAFSILAFQTFLGIHPYKGKHTKFTTLDERMQNNISVLNKEVRVPSCVKPVSVIPKVYLDWFEAVLEKGRREAPPKDFTHVITVVTPVYTISKDSFVITLAKTVQENISKAQHGFLFTGNNLVSPNDTIYRGNGEIITVGPQNIPYLFYISNSKISLRNMITKEEKHTELVCESYVVNNNRILFKLKGQIYLLKIVPIGNNVVISSVLAANCMENSTKGFSGVYIQSILDTYYASITPEGNTHHFLKLDEVKERIVNASNIDNILILITFSKGNLKQYLYKFSEDFSERTLEVSDVTTADINFTILENGVVLLMQEDGIHGFHKKISSTQRKIMTDSNIDSSCILTTWDHKAAFIKDKSIYTFSTQ